MSLMHYHFDPVGGIAGDMFVAALLDMHPEQTEGAINAVRIAGIEPKVTLERVDFTDGVLSGSRFEVGLPTPEPHHHHVHWSALRNTLEQSELTSAVRDRALAIFARLAEAEASVHNKPVADVVFHEVGAWDSIADIVAAAYLIEALSPCTWSVGSIPVGSGRVRTEHGLLPLPAPATTLLLEGFKCFDDGFVGERVTPTGAAIIKDLEPAHGIGSIPRIMSNNGYGFGTRRFEGMSNVLRVLEYEPAPAERVVTDTVTVINFEVDDQTAEDLAFGLDQLRKTDGVIDVIQTSAVSKHGRMATSVQILAEPDKAAAITDACFRETTTIGLRVGTTERLKLNRREVSASGDTNVKIAERPGKQPQKRIYVTLRTATGTLVVSPNGEMPKSKHCRIAARSGSALNPGLSKLERILRTCTPAAIAISGGVDSMTLANVANRVLGSDVLMYHATSPAVPESATERVKRHAKAHDWQLHIIDAGEFDDDQYINNPANRCFFCKQNLYGTIVVNTNNQVLSGTNLDDLGDWRPGLKAAENHSVRHPFVEAEIDKQGVRAIARELGLADIAELPAAPCLSSRVETGIPINARELRFIDATERMIRDSIVSPAVRCRIRKSGIVVELDLVAHSSLLAKKRESLARNIRRLAAQYKVSGDVTFEPYRRGSAFLREQQ